MPFLRVTLLLLLCFNHILAQDFGRGWLLSLNHGETPQRLCKDFARENQTTEPLMGLVSQTLNAWKLDHPDEQLLGRWLAKQGEIRQLQKNRLIQLRSVDSIPNDPNFLNQWQHLNPGGSAAVPNADHDAELAWDISRGGLSPTGDTLVIAVIDGGVNNHPDVAPNIWRNWAETPADGIDNDGNGFIDDYRGWNFFANNNNIAGTATGHGTPVCALIGAKGNNGIGIAGVNWNVKIMFVAGGSDDERVIKSYDYILQSRKRYNASFGQSGAFVIATNASFGIDNAQAADHPLWCAMYDSLGKAGVINIAATANNPVNVDEVGDMPTACSSPFLIGVTSLTKQNVLAGNAAWGATHVDLAAFGEGVYTTDGASSYGPRGGTSFAAPHVAGSVGLLYAAPCPNLIALAKSDPASAALKTRELILSATVPVEELQGRTATGGRLNLHQMLKVYQELCSNCPPPVVTLIESLSPDMVQFKWVDVVANEKVLFRWRKSGDDLWNVVENAQTGLLLQGLSACSVYEFQLRSVCSNNANSDWSPVQKFNTIGCCSPPGTFQVLTSTVNSLTFKWPSDGANPFVFRFRKVNGAWKDLPVEELPFTLEGLNICTDYEYQVAVNCSDGTPLQFSAVQLAATSGCGACLDANYCVAKANNADEEWIKKVEIGSWVSETLNGGPGYQNLTNESSSVLDLVPGWQYPLTLTPGFLGQGYKEYFRVYVDFNNDGDFADDFELAFDPGFASDVPVSGTINVPLNVVTGKARMRVLMRFSQNGNIAPLACGSFDFGQVEDYCVFVGSGGSGTDSPGVKPLFRLAPNPAESEIVLSGLPGNQQTQVQVFNALGHLIGQKETHGESDTFDVTHWNPGVYFVKIRGGYGGQTLKFIKK